MIRLSLLVLSFALSLAGCMSGSIEPSVLMTGVAMAPTAMARMATPTALHASTAQLEQGLRVYRAQYCGVCHQLSVAETTGQFGPSHDGMARTAQARLLNSGYTGSASTPDEYLSESILTPEVYIVDGYAVSSHHMPSYAHLSPQEIDALVYLLAHQR